jgi:hypothetical protein
MATMRTAFQGAPLTEAEWTQSRQMGLTEDQFQDWKSDPARFDYNFGQFKDASGKYVIPSNAQARSGYIPTEGYQGRLGLNDDQYAEFALNPNRFSAQFGQYRDTTGKYNIPVLQTQSPAAGAVGSPTAGGGGGGFSWGQSNPELGYWGLPKMATAPAAQPPSADDAAKNFRNTNYFGLKNYGA